MMKDSIYFKDANEGKTKCCTQIYYDCKGEPYSISYEEELPYLQEQEILAPVFISTTLGSEVYYKATIVKSAYKKRKKTLIHINRPLKVGDILGVQGTCKAKYYIKRKLGKDIYNKFIIEIKRLDGNSIVSLNMAELTKGTRLFVKGFFSEKK